MILNSFCFGMPCMYLYWWCGCLKLAVTCDPTVVPWIRASPQVFHESR